MLLKNPSKRKALKKLLENKNAIDFVEMSWNEISEIWEKKQKEKYLYAIYLCFALIEEALRLTVFTYSSMEIAPAGSKRDVVGKREYSDYIKELMSYFRDTNFYNLIRWALILKLIDSNLFKDLEKIRKERNELVHKIWAEFRKQNNAYLRRKLEFYGRVCSEVLELFGKIYPLKEIYDFDIIKRLIFK